VTETATLFNIQRFSTEDGPGIRTTLFFKGCPLACPWCQNPEGMDAGPQTVWQAVHCLACGDCERACPDGALCRRDGRTEIDRTLCLHCGTCAEACPSAALEVVGKSYGVEALLALAQRDRPFFEKSGGGITLSGGEPLLQHPFLREFLPRCREARLQVALDTSGCARPEVVTPLLDWIDLVLFDLKLMDPEDHQRLVGVPLPVVLRCLEAVVASGRPLWIRTPLIPGMTDHPENIRAVAAYLAGNVPTLARWDLLAYSNLCAGKYGMLGRPFALAGVPLLERAAVERLAAVAAQAGISGVRWSGPTRAET
jgi:pyruvate formate lyase activating enzyme